MKSIESLNQSRILIVDDEKTNIDILVHLLYEHYEIIVATDGVEALDLVWEKSPDLILLDIMMPFMDGYEVLKNLKENPKTEAIPVILLSALREVENKAKGFKLGAVDYVTKPFNEEEVRVRVNTHISLAKSKKALSLQNGILEKKS